MLQKLPHTTKDHLTEMLPEISKQLMVNIFHDLDKVTQSIYANIVAVEAKLVKSSEEVKAQLNDAIKTSLSFDNFLFKKILINILIVVLVSMGSATGMSYLMIKKYPQHIELKTDKSVTVHDSDVTFFGAKNLQIISKKER